VANGDYREERDTNRNRNAADGGATLGIQRRTASATVPCRNQSEHGLQEHLMLIPMNRVGGAQLGER